MCSAAIDWPRSTAGWLGLHNSMDETESGNIRYEGFGSENYYGDCFPFLRRIIRPPGVVKSRPKTEPRAAAKVHFSLISIQFSSRQVQMIFTASHPWINHSFSQLRT